jgi:hypothetical protein
VGASEVGFTVEGVHDRPWSPAHLRASARGDGGFDLAWAPRLRIDGDRWDGQVVAPDLLRFRIRVLEGADQKRAFEVEATTATYVTTDLAEDFPGGPGVDARVAVAQWGEGYGWGVETSVALIS